MNSISIRWERRAVKELGSLEKAQQQKVFGAAGALAKDPLKGVALSGDLKGLGRIRVGFYRVIYAFDGVELLVSVVRVGHRKDVYR